MTSCINGGAVLPNQEGTMCVSEIFHFVCVRFDGRIRAQEELPNSLSRKIWSLNGSFGLHLHG